MLNALKDSRFLLALTTAVGPVAGHALEMYWLAFPVFFVAIPLLDVLFGRSVRPSSADEIARLEGNAFFRFVLHAWVPIQLALIGWGAWLVGAGGLSTGDAVLFTLSVGVATGGTGITIAHEESDGASDHRTAS